MSLLDWLLVAAASWLILACCVAVPIGRAMRKAEDTQRATYPPPPPPVKQAEIDSLWLSVWPTAVDEDELMDAEFVSLISTTWHWPEDADA